MLNENAIASAFAVSIPPVVPQSKPVVVPTVKQAPTVNIAPVTPELAAKRDAKVEAIVRQLRPTAETKQMPDGSQQYVSEEYAKFYAPRAAKGQPLGTMTRKVRGYFLDLYRATHPTNKDGAIDAVNSLIQGALDRGVIWQNIGGGLTWYYSSAEYPKPVSKAAIAQEQAKAEAAELGW